MKTALIGYGHWGKNIARVLAHSSHFKLQTICAPSAPSRALVAADYPTVNAVAHISEVPTDTEVVAIMTPASNHYETASYFLARGCHVLVAKPLALKAEQAQALCELSRSKGVALCCDTTFVFSPAVRALKRELAGIGDPKFVLSKRLGPGRYQEDMNVLWDLLPHDLSILLELFEAPIARSKVLLIHADGKPHAQVADVSLELENHVSAFVSLSWRSPKKIRQFFVAGSKGALVFDDTLPPAQKLQRFDGVFACPEFESFRSEGDAIATLCAQAKGRSAVHVASDEPLAIEMEHLWHLIAEPSRRSAELKRHHMLMSALEKTAAG